eukprot:8542437-Alexandrium_andersonii.AAC.1
MQPRGTATCSKRAPCRRACKRLARRGRPHAAINPQSTAAALSKRPESGSRCTGSKRRVEHQTTPMPYTVKASPHHRRTHAMDAPRRCATAQKLDDQQARQERIAPMC